MNVMKPKTLAWTVLAASLLGAVAVRAEISYPVLEIEDGDTLILEIDGRTQRVQLLGIDAPEDAENAKFNLDLKQTGLAAAQLMALGEAATAYLGQLVGESARVSLEADLDSRDKYGRIPARVFNAEGRPLAEAMVQDGYAIALPSASMDSDYIERLDRLERFARKRGDGLWGSHAETTRAWYDRTR